MSINYGVLPLHTQASARSYIEDGLPPGGFLTAVICNDLAEAFGRADDINRARLSTIIGWFYTEAPSDSWGSREVMNKWLASFRHSTAN